jgi:hypothetical protein
VEFGGGCVSSTVPYYKWCSLPFIAFVPYGARGGK